MEKHHRERIDECCDEISSEITIRHLWPRLIELGVFNEDDVNIPVWEADLENIETIREILLTIKTRGPQAFKKLLVSLRSTGHNNPANILEGREIHYDTNVTNNNNDTGTNETSEKTNDDFYKNLQTSMEPLEVRVRKATTFMDYAGFTKTSVYPMRSNPRGFVLIITIINYMNDMKRESAEHDEANLKKLFNDMGFTVETYRDLTGAEIKRIVNEFSKRSELANVSSSFVIISAHGDETTINGKKETEIQGVDYQLSSAVKVYRDDIIDMFTVENCKNMMGKPKIFIFQSCRGNRYQESLDRTVADGVEPETKKYRNYSDILITHSTISGHYSYRDNFTGSWYIQILCEVFMNYAYNTHLYDLLCMVDRRLKIVRVKNSREESQTSTIKSIGFNKHCYLNPGLFEES